MDTEKIPTLPPKALIQTRGCEVRSEDVDEEKREAKFSFSSRTFIPRWFGHESLSHEKGAIVTARLDRGMVPFLLDHDRFNWRSQIGVISEYKFENGKGYATARFSETDQVREILRDIKARIRTNISVGYIVHDMRRLKRDELDDLLDEEEKPDEDEDEDYFTIERWEPIEISLVNIPADTNVGIGRSETLQGYEVRVFNPREEVTPEPPVSTPMNQAPSMEPQIEVNEQAITDARSAEQLRVRDLMRLGDFYKHKTDADRFVTEGRAVGEFQRFILDEQMKRGESTIVPAVPQPVNVSQRDIGRYSLLKALREGQEGLSGLEREVSVELTRQLGRQPAGFFMPDFAFTRQLSAGVPSAGGLTIQNTIEPSLIELLRNLVITGKAGATMMGGLVGNLSMPRQTGAATATWEAENAAIAPSAQAFDQVPLAPKRLATQTAYSKLLLAQSSLDIEVIVRDDLLRIIALGQDLAAIAGTGPGANPQPTGILTVGANVSGVGNLYNPALRSPDQTFGAAATYGSVGTFEGAGEDSNVQLDETAAYLTTPHVKAKWKVLPKAVNFPSYLWEPDSEVNGYRAFATKQIPADRVIFGKWRELMIATWSGLDIVTDPYSLAQNFQIRVIMNLLTDVAFRHAIAFTASTDAGNQ